MKKELPLLHREAFMFKNTKRLQHDGGRAWSGDSQLQEIRKNGNGKLYTIHSEKKMKRLEEAEDHKPSY